jgi:hypothetical protein
MPTLVIASIVPQNGCNGDRTTTSSPLDHTSPRSMHLSLPNSRRQRNGSSSATNGTSARMTGTRPEDTRDRRARQHHKPCDMGHVRRCTRSG